MNKAELKYVTKEVNDLGVAAYLLMFGFTPTGSIRTKKGKIILFKVEESSIEEFDKKTLEYLSSSFHRFDACLMSLKKMN